MDTLPLWVKIVGFIVGGTFLTGMGTLIKIVWDKIDERRREKREQARAEITQSVELRRLEQEDDEKAKAELWRLLENAKEEIRTLKAELQEADGTNSLSRTTITRIYNHVRKVRRQIDILDSLIIRGEAHSNLEKEIEILKQNFDELEKNLP